MRQIAAVRALAGVVAAGVLAASVAPVAAGSPGPSVVPDQSPWPAQSVLILQLRGRDGDPLTQEQVAATQAVVEARLSALGTLVSVTPIPDDRLRLDLADATMRDAVGHVATAVGELQFVPVPDEFADAVVDGQPLPVGMPVEPLFGGEGVVQASIGSNQSGLASVDVVLGPDAATAFDAYAAAHYGGRFAIVLDGTVVGAPTINATRFEGRAQISGGFDLPAVQQLVAILTGGVLPVTAEVLTVCPAIGDCPVSSPVPSLTSGG